MDAPLSNVQIDSATTPWSACAGTVDLENDIDVGWYDSGRGSLLSWKTIEWPYVTVSNISGNIRYFAFAFDSDFEFAPPGRPGERVVNAIPSSCATTNSGVHSSRKVYEQMPSSC